MGNDDTNHENHIVYHLSPFCWISLVDYVVAWLEPGKHGVNNQDTGIRPLSNLRMFDVSFLGRYKYIYIYIYVYESRSRNCLASPAKIWNGIDPWFSSPWISFADVKVRK